MTSRPSNQPSQPTNQPSNQPINPQECFKRAWPTHKRRHPKKKEAKGEEAKPSPPASGRTAEQQAHDLGMTRALAMLSSELGELGLDVESAFRNPEFLAAAASFAEQMTATAAPTENDDKVQVMAEGSGPEANVIPPIHPKGERLG